MSLARDLPEIFDEPESFRGSVITQQPQFPVIIGRSESHRIESAQTLVESLSQSYDGLQRYVILKNAGAIVELSLEIAKQAALDRMDNKEELIYGVKVAQRRTTAYEYAHPRLAEIELEMKRLKDEKKKLETMMQNMAEPMFDTKTGCEIMPAKLTKDGINIFLTLPK